MFVWITCVWPRLQSFSLNFLSVLSLPAPGQAKTLHKSWQDHRGSQPRPQIYLTTLTKDNYGSAYWKLSIASWKCSIKLGSPGVLPCPHRTVSSWQSQLPPWETPLRLQRKEIYPIPTGQHPAFQSQNHTLKSTDPSLELSRQFFISWEIKYPVSLNTAQCSSRHAARLPGLCG